MDKKSFIGLNILRNLAIVGFVSGGVCTLIEMLLPPRWHHVTRYFDFEYVGVMLLLLSPPLLVVTILLRETVDLVKNRGLYSLRGLLILMTLVALVLVLTISMLKAFT